MVIPKIFRRNPDAEEVSKRLDGITDYLELRMSKPLSDEQGQLVQAMYAAIKCCKFQLEELSSGFFLERTNPGTE